MFTCLFGRFLRKVFSLLRSDGILCIHKVLAWRHRFFFLSKILSAFFTRCLVQDSPPSVHDGLCSKTDFPYPYFRCRKRGYFRFRILANHLAFFFPSLVTECKHLLTFTRTHILYFHGQAGRSWPTLLFLFLAVSLWRPTNSNTGDSRNSLFLFSQWETMWQYIYIYIYIFWNRSSSVWLDTRDCSNWVRNPGDFKTVRYLTLDPSAVEEFKAYVLFFLCLQFALIGYWSVRFISRALYYVSDKR